MKKVTSALALAALVGSPAAFAIDVNFGGDADFGVYGTRDGASNNLGTGAEQRIRLATSVETDGGVEVHARLNLFNDRWTGDNSGVSTQDDTPYSLRDHRNVELDYGYVSMRTALGQLNIGRQQANWNNNFTTSDDRRDRVSLVTPLGGGHTMITVYDRRQDATTQSLDNPPVEGSDSDRQLDGHLGFFAFIGPLAENVSYGLLLAQFEAGGSGATTEGEIDGEAADLGYGPRGATLIAPYVEGEAGDLDYRIGGHYFGNGHGPAFNEDSFGIYAQSGFQLTPEFKMEGQVMYADGGTLVAGGYDSYSSLIHNSPDHDLTATRIAGLDMGGLGNTDQEDDSVTLIATRGTYEMMDWTFMGALGWVNYDRPSEDVDEDVVFADLQAHYQLTESTTVYGTFGYADTEDFLGNNSHASSLNVSVQF
ncbi:porin [Aquisalimonas asiatica]|uniref:Porin n=1 Tax=Aquisalimonas asiatica TaxID=406100 RepID=A0A1H8VKT6_9GAMM|nr:porin [Aquisalimonas asiatica]SEP15989.1 porin [Aquisalimonas asiatica]